MTPKWRRRSAFSYATFLVAILPWLWWMSASDNGTKIKGLALNPGSFHSLSSHARLSSTMHDFHHNEKANDVNRKTKRSLQQLAKLSSENSSSIELGSRQRENEISSSNGNVAEKPLTWLQIIQAELQARPEDLVKERVLVSPGITSPTTKEENQLKRILFWNHETFYFGVGRDPFLRAGCPVNSCYITTNRNEVPYQELDALVWIPLAEDRSFPPVRSPHTRYVYYLWESPLTAGVNTNELEKIKGVFNYTMTYRRDSDIFNPYGSFIRLETHRTHLRNKDYARGKTKQAAWFVSKCGAVNSGRATLGQELERYISVDIYGACGTMNCQKTDHDYCYGRAAAMYKFYLSFENSLCDDYITEKFFLTSRYDILPVVYGLGAYEETAPPHSFINVFDFPSVRHLADYLIYLDKNDTAYNEYFQWKINYEAVNSETNFYTHNKSVSWCQLCEKLHTDKEVRIHTDLHEWTSPSPSCLSFTQGAVDKFLKGENASNLA
ncbi:glycoprotein 3-alpha-L-fucosyltransferase A [Hyalella azteca]|uniref:Fucosyltransferase n=1 Tax=Hyalella azteca TaxID=294128 RepID=A0A8B7NBL1_HYAAZ|nr:glycoprotein 3-alpha-L-fucosyltransferase A [Hyalella azteca]